MTVYVAQRTYEYEFSVVIGVFETRGAAQKCCDGDKDENGRTRGDSYDVGDFEIGESCY